MLSRFETADKTKSFEYKTFGENIYFVSWTVESWLNLIFMFVWIKIIKTHKQWFANSLKKQKIMPLRDSIRPRGITITIAGGTNNIWFTHFSSTLINHILSTRIERSKNLINTIWNYYAIIAPFIDTFLVISFIIIRFIKFFLFFSILYL